MLLPGRLRWFLRLGFGCASVLGAQAPPASSPVKPEVAEQTCTVLHGLAPGNYKLFGWEGVETEAWEDPDFLKEYEDQGQPINVEDGDEKSIDLKLIPAKDS
jgi:hypothetical protein